MLANQNIDARESMLRERLDSKLNTEKEAITSIDIQGLKCSQPILTYLIDNLIKRIKVGPDGEPLLYNLCLKSLPTDVTLPFQLCDLVASKCGNLESFTLADMTNVNQEMKESLKYLIEQVLSTGRPTTLELSQLGFSREMGQEVV